MAVIQSRKAAAEFNRIHKLGNFCQVITECHLDGHHHYNLYFNSDLKRTLEDRMQFGQLEAQLERKDEGICVSWVVNLNEIVVLKKKL